MATRTGRPGSPPRIRRVPRTQPSRETRLDPEGRPGSGGLADSGPRRQRRPARATPLPRRPGHPVRRILLRCPAEMIRLRARVLTRVADPVRAAGRPRSTSRRAHSGRPPSHTRPRLTVRLVATAPPIVTAMARPAAITAPATDTVRRPATCRLIPTFPGSRTFRRIHMPRRIRTTRAIRPIRACRWTRTRRPSRVMPRVRPGQPHRAAPRPARRCLDRPDRLNPGRGCRRPALPGESPASRSRENGWPTSPGRAHTARQ